MRARLAIAFLPWLGPLVAAAVAQVPAGGEFQVNTYTTGGQGVCSVASDTTGNFVIAWQSLGQDGYGYGVFARRFDVSGAPRGDEFRVNTFTTGDQVVPRVASSARGNFIVIWSEVFGRTSGAAGQLYAADGAPRGAEFYIGAFLMPGPKLPSVASDAAGNFVVTYGGVEASTGAFGVFAQRFDAAGLPAGQELHVNTYTTGHQGASAVSMDATGNFVIAWQSLDQDGSGYGVFARRFDDSGAPRGAEFRVNSYTTNYQRDASVASDAAGNFVVIWDSRDQDGNSHGVFGQLYDASGAPRGTEFQVNTYTKEDQSRPAAAMDAAGNFVVAWGSPDQDASGVFARRFDALGAPRGSEYQVNTWTSSAQRMPFVAADAIGNFVVAWESYGPDGSALGVFGQRFGGLQPAGLLVDPDASGGSDGNGVLEPSESVEVRPSWRNTNGGTQTFDATIVGFTGPDASGVSYELIDGTGSYGSVANGATGLCSDCYQVRVPFGGVRPSTHWDATLTERLTPDALGQTKLWLLHLGESFVDVPRTSDYYRFVEALLHAGVTGGCGADSYCPASPVTREQLAVFVLVGNEGAGYRPGPCGTPVFGDVPASSPFCRYVEELARRGVTAGCGGGNYCPTDAVTREQMSVFLLRTLDPSLSPPPCMTPVFGDVPAASPFCRWIEELARRGITGGCGGDNYCPTSPVTREQMAAFIGVTFGLDLYGP